MSAGFVSTWRAAQMLGVGRTKMAAIKRAMGVRGHSVNVSKALRWLADHPEFTVTGVYEKKPK